LHAFGTDDYNLEFLLTLSQLIDLATLIKQNPTLQTSSMESCLDSCTHRIEEFQQLLEKIAVDVSDSKWKRLRKSFEAVLKEKEVIELFANLEREKSSLVLCIAEIDSCVMPIVYTKQELTFLLDHCFTLLVSM
jgi:ABC-type Fe2+-enterobactin transport system substrate-binding protein